MILRTTTTRVCRSLALSTRHLEIQYTPLGTQAGLVGAGVLAMQETLKVRGVAP